MLRTRVEIVGYIELEAPTEDALRSIVKERIGVAADALRDDTHISAADIESCGLGKIIEYNKK